MREAAFFDADGTLFPGFSIYPYYSALEANGIITSTDNKDFQNILAEFEHPETQTNYHTFMFRTVEKAAELVAGKNESLLEHVALELFSDSSFEWYRASLDVIQAMKARGVSLNLVTGEPQFIANAIACVQGMNTCHSTQFISRAGIMTGDIGAVLSSSAKQRIIEDASVDADYVYGFGDSEGDVGMLQAVDSPWVVSDNGKPSFADSIPGVQFIYSPRQPLPKTAFGPRH